MKSKLRLWWPLGLVSLLLFTGLCGLRGQVAPPPPRPVVPPAPPAASPVGTALAVDPTTGLPIAAPAPLPSWMDPNWSDPNIVLTNLTYDNLPLSEIAKDLRDRFKDYFDVLLPVNSANEAEGMAVDWGSVGMRLSLHNVRASEVFHAMNLVFENDRTPLRWELKLNVHDRPIVLLRVLAEPKPPTPPRAPPEPKRMVYFVGDLLSDGKPGGMTLKQVVETLAEVSKMANGQPVDLQFHEAAQLVVASGPADQLRFLEMTLSALRQKVELERKSQEKPAVSGPQPSVPKRFERTGPQ